VTDGDEDEDSGEGDTTAVEEDEEGHTDEECKDLSVDDSCLISDSEFISSDDLLLDPAT
jgi:hypothetical protein